MSNKQRIGIFGGTFNPPHIGHIAAAKSFYDELCLDRMLIVPSNIPVHKQISSMDDPLYRYAMCKKAFLEDTGERNYTLSDIEISRKGKSYTVDTVKELLEIYPDAELFLYVGTDMFCCFEEWKEFEYLFSALTVACAKRSSKDGEKIEEYARKYREKYGARVILLENEPIDISSTEIRNSLLYKNEEKFKNYLTCSVYEYIIKHSVYADKIGEPLSERVTKREILPEMEKYVRSRLSQYRLAHTLAVRDKALQLATELLCEYGYGEEYLADIEAAALLHDCTKELEKEEQRKLFQSFSSEKIYSESILHSRSAAYVARVDFLVNDRVFSAIYYHTSAKADMNIFEKIIYLADYIEETRKYEECIQLREYYHQEAEKCKKEKRSLKEALNRTLERSFKMTLSHLEESGKSVHPDLYTAAAFYSEEKNLHS